MCRGFRSPVLFGSMLVLPPTGAPRWTRRPFPVSSGTHWYRISKFVRQGTPKTMTHFLTSSDESSGPLSFVLGPDLGSLPSLFVFLLSFSVIGVGGVGPTPHLCPSQCGLPLILVHRPRFRSTGLRFSSRISKVSEVRISSTEINE